MSKDQVFRELIWEQVRSITGEPKTYKDVIITKDTITFMNILRDNEVVAKEVLNSFRDEVDDGFAMWVKWDTKTMETPFNKVGVYQMPNTLKDKPIVACDYHYVVSFKSSKEGMLRYIEYEVNKRLNQRKKLEKLNG